MEKVFIDLWPYIITALVAVVGWQWKTNHATQMRVAVMEKAIEDLLKTIDAMQKRQDSHSQKQDEILEKLRSVEHELLKQMGTMGASISSLASDLKGLSNFIAMSDMGIKLNK